MFFSVVQTFDVVYFVVLLFGCDWFRLSLSPKSRRRHYGYRHVHYRHWILDFVVCCLWRGYSRCYHGTLVVVSSTVVVLLWDASITVSPLVSVFFVSRCCLLCAVEILKWHTPFDEFRIPSLIWCVSPKARVRPRSKTNDNDRNHEGTAWTTLYSSSARSENTNWTGLLLQTNNSKMQ